MANVFYGRKVRDGETPDRTIDGVGYVGVELPDINEVWTDKETYPHATVYVESADDPNYANEITLGMTSDPQFFKKFTSDGITGYWLDTNAHGVSFHTVAFAPDTLEVVFNRHLTTDDNSGLSGAIPILNGIPHDRLCWTSYNIHENNEEGPVYLAAEDCVCIPIPVGSAPEVDPKSFMAGWRMGQLVRGMRG